MGHEFSAPRIEGMKRSYNYDDEEDLIRSMNKMKIPKVRRTVGGRSDNVIPLSEYQNPMSPYFNPNFNRLNDPEFIEDYDVLPDSEKNKYVKGFLKCPERVYQTWKINS